MIALASKYLQELPSAHRIKVKLLSLALKKLCNSTSRPLRSSHPQFLSVHCTNQNGTTGYTEHIFGIHFFVPLFIQVLGFLFCFVFDGPSAQPKTYLSSDVFHPSRPNFSNLTAQPQRKCVPALSSCRTSLRLYHSLGGAQSNWRLWSACLFFWACVLSPC